MSRSVFTRDASTEVLHSGSLPSGGSEALASLSKIFAQVYPCCLQAFFQSRSLAQAQGEQVYLRG